MILVIFYGIHYDTVTLCSFFAQSGIGGEVYMKNRGDEAKRFIEVWQTAESVDEVVRKMGMRGKRTAIQRAARYRAQGVGLKRMPTGFDGSDSLDWEELSNYANSFDV